MTRWLAYSGAFTYYITENYLAYSGPFTYYITDNYHLVDRAYYFVFQARPESAEWEEMEELPLETRCKIEGMKMMARYENHFILKMNSISSLTNCIFYLNLKSK